MNARQLGNALPGFYRIDDLKGTDGEIVTISQANVRPVGQDQEEKPVLDFLETNKSLVLNKIRAQQLQDIFGDNELKGQKIKVLVREQDVRGRKLEMIVIEPA